MNEFTKSELQEMKDSIFYHEEEYIGECKNPLVKKIQHMINNYCEHYWVTDPRLHFMSNPAKIKCACTKCPATRYIDIIDINEPAYCEHSGIKLEHKNG